jgi:SAM-dependent methyltransferase
MTAIPACPLRCHDACRFAFTVGAFDVYRCQGCGLYLLSGGPQTGDLTLDRTQFDEAFRTLRLSNYRRIFDAVSQHIALKSARLLDVGSSSGWFLHSAAEHGCACFGIEPDAYFGERAKSSLPPAVSIVGGYFPQDLPAEWGSFDIITFHDVFEHLDDPEAVLAACRARLKAQGLVVLSLPSADGFAFRLGQLLWRLGWKRPLERIFQVNYPFPHLYYFTPRSLARLAASTGFDIIGSGPVDGFAVRGSLRRARLDESTPGVGIVGQYATALGLLGLALLQRVVPADSIYVILRPKT